MVGGKRPFNGLGGILLVCFDSAGGGIRQPAAGPLVKTLMGQGCFPGESSSPIIRGRKWCRKDWMNLGTGFGILRLRLKDAASQPGFQCDRILVPFPVESALSGVMKMVSENDRIWYHRSFDVPRGWTGKRVLLHFGAVDFETRVMVTGKDAGVHRGGYDAFAFDITDLLNPTGANELVVSVWDPTDAGTQPRGKQVRKPNGIWYTPTSGIWQTVWLEPVNAAYIRALKITPNIADGTVTIQPSLTATMRQYTVETAIHDGLDRVSGGSGRAGEEIKMPVAKAKLWSPEKPHLYTLTVSLKLGNRTVDKVESYFGMRKISLEQG